MNDEYVEDGLIVCERCFGSGFDGYGTGYSEVCPNCTGGYVGKIGEDDVKMMKKNFVFLDLETTGLDPADNHVTEIAAIKTDQEGNELARYHRYVKVPEGFILSDFIVEYTGITNKLLDEHGIHPLVAFGMLHEFIDDDSIVVAQFAAFDLSFIEKHFPVENFICTRTMSYEINPKIKAGLKDIAGRFGIDLGRHHSAIDDANTCKEIFFKMNEMLQRIPDKDAALGLVNVVGQSNQRKIARTPSAMKELREYGV